MLKKCLWLSWLSFWIVACSASGISGDDPCENCNDTEITTPNDTEEVTTQDTTSDDATDTTSDDAVDTTSDDAEDTSPTVCQPNNDGILTRQEVAVSAGLRGNFRVANNATVDLAGTPISSGTQWDLVTPLQSGRPTTVYLYAVEGEWFATDFPSATYFAELTYSSDLRGVFEVTDTSLLLLGVVSPQGGAQSTLVSYDPPIPVLKFPMQLDDTWQTETTASGTYEGWSVSYTETYTSTVDAVGTALIPFFPSGMPVFRINTHMKRGMYTLVWPYYKIIEIRTFAFASECFGTIATVTSQEDETTNEFSTAAEIRALAP